jgi:predicted DNA-binding transcriptional regulator AlpA
MSRCSVSLVIGNEGIRIVSQEIIMLVLLAIPERVLEKLALSVGWLLAEVERVLEKLALSVGWLLAEVERVLAVLVSSVLRLLQNPIPLRSFTNIIKLPKLTFECIKG